MILSPSKDMVMVCVLTAPQRFTNTSPSTHAGPSETLISLFSNQGKALASHEKGRDRVSCHSPASTLKPPATTKAEGKEKFRSSGGTTDLFPLTTSATSATKHGPLPQVQWAVRVHAQPSSGNHPSPRLSPSTPQKQHVG